MLTLREPTASIGRSHETATLERPRRRPSLPDGTAALVALRRVHAELAGSQSGERRARYRALHDGFSTLPNRCHFRERLASAVDEARARRSRVAVFYMDLDGFKPINDAHGGQVGDALRRIVAARLARALRGEDMVSHVGDDEFACLIEGLVNRDHVCRLAEKLARTIAAPVRIGELNVTVRASIGIALSPDDGQTSHVLLKHADEAMYRAKSGPADYAFFDKRIDS